MREHETLSCREPVFFLVSLLYRSVLLYIKHSGVAEVCGALSEVGGLEHLVSKFSIRGPHIRRGP